MSLRERPRELVSSSVAVELPTTAIPFPTFPVSGFDWDLRRLVVVDARDLFRVHCDAIVAISTPHDSLTVPQASDVADFRAEIPAAFHWSKGTIVALPSERITVYVSNAIPGRSLVAVAQIEEARDSRFT